MTAFDHLHETIQAINLQCLAHGGKSFKLVIGTIEKTDTDVPVLQGDISLCVAENTSSRFREEISIPEAACKSLEGAARKLIRSDAWAKWVIEHQDARDKAIKVEGIRREESIEKHDARLAELHELPTFRATPDDPKPKPHRATALERAVNEDT